MQEQPKQSKLLWLLTVLWTPPLWTVLFFGIRQLPTANPTVSFALSHWYTSKYPVGPQFTIVALRRCRLQCSFVHWASASLHPAQRALSSCPVAGQLGDSWPGKRSKYQIAQKQTARFCVLLAFVVSGSYLSSRAVSSQVLSAYKGLTSVFGMGTGGTPWLNHRNGYGVFSTHLENCIAFQFASIKPSTY